MMVLKEGKMPIRFRIQGFALGSRLESNTWTPDVV